MNRLPPRDIIVDTMALLRNTFLAISLMSLAGTFAVAGGGAGSGDAVELPTPRLAVEVPLHQALRERRSVRSYQDRALGLAEVGQLLWAAQGVTDARTGYRAAPSAGATFPLEVYLVAGEVEGLAPGLYRYVPYDHALLPLNDSDLRAELHAVGLRQESLRAAPAVLVISAVHSRTARRYGARAERYVAMEAGHASQNIYLQAVALGLGTVAIGAFDDAGVSRVLSLPGNEQPLYLMPVGVR